MKRILLLASVLWANSLFASESLNLASCLKLAFENNHLLQAAQLGIDASGQELEAVKGQSYPALNLSAAYTHIGKISSFSFPSSSGGPPRELSFGTPNKMNADIKLQLPVFTWWRISNSIALAEKGREMSRLQFEQNRLQLTGRVLRAYYGVLINNAVIRLLEDDLKRTKQFLSITQKRYESGELPKHELLRAQVQLANEENGLNTALGNQKNSRIFLSRVIGRPDEQMNASGELNFISLETDEDNLINSAMNRRLELRQLKLQREMNRNQTGLADAGNKPILAFFSGYNITNGFDPMDPQRFVDNWNVGMRLSWPVFDGFTTSHKTQAALINEKISGERAEDMKENVILQVKKALVIIRQMENSIASRRENIELAGRVQKMTEEQYKNGFTSSLQLLLSQKDLLDAEISYLQAVFNHIMAKIDLSKAVADYSWFESDVE